MQQADRRERRRERLELFRLGSYHGPPALLIVRPARFAVEPAVGWVTMASPRVAAPQAEPILGHPRLISADLGHPRLISAEPILGQAVD